MGGRLRSLKCYCATADDLEEDVDLTLSPRQGHIKYASLVLTQLWPTLR